MKSRHVLFWDFKVPLLTNSFIVYQTTLLCLITGVVMCGLLGFVLLMQGESSAIPQLFMLITAIIAGLWVSLLLIMLLIFGNRMPMRFAVERTGVSAEITSSIGKKANRLAILLGLFTGKPGLVGTGLIAKSQESVSYAWSDIAKVDFNPHKHQIIFSNSWRPLVAMYCLPSNYLSVHKLVTTYFKPKPAIPNPLPGLLMRTVLTFLATVPLFMLDYPFKPELFLTLILICFSLATIWLIPLMGYVVILSAIAMFASLFWQGITYRLTSPDDWVNLAIASAGLLYFIWTSWRSLKGKDPSGLFTA